MDIPLAHPPIRTEKNDPATILGLSLDEKRIIQVTAKYAKSMSDIARLAKIPRSSVPYMLKKLEQRGFMKEIRMDKTQKRSHWRSEMQKPLRALGEMPPIVFAGGLSLQSAHAGIVTYHGTGAILDIFERLIDMPKNSRLIAFQPDKSFKSALKKIKIMDILRLNEGIKRKALIVEGMVHEKSTRMIVQEFGKDVANKIFDSFIGRLEDYVQIPDDFADVDSEIYIFGGRAYLINWNTEVAIEISDKNMVALLHAMLTSVKELGTRYSQNKNMEGLKNVLHSPKYASTTSLRDNTSPGFPSAKS